MTESDDEKGLTATETAKLHNGYSVVDGPFKLETHPDSGWKYRIEANYEKHGFSYAFDRVEHTGESVWNLAESDESAGMFLENLEEYPQLVDALITLSNGTPNKAKDR